MILLDTHVLIWLLTDRARLSAASYDAILQARVTHEKLACSPVSFYEIAYAVRRNRLKLTVPTKEFLAAVRLHIDVLPLTDEIIICAAELPESFHGDPMDRIITATAIVSEATLITKDDKIREAKLCKLLW